MSSEYLIPKSMRGFIKEQKNAVADLKKLCSPSKLKGSLNLLDQSEQALKEWCGDRTSIPTIITMRIEEHWGNLLITGLPEEILIIAASRRALRAAALDEWIALARATGTLSAAERAQLNPGVNRRKLTLSQSVDEYIKDLKMAEIRLKGFCSHQDVTDSLELLDQSVRSLNSWSNASIGSVEILTNSIQRHWGNLLITGLPEEILVIASMRRALRAIRLNDSFMIESAIGALRSARRVHGKRDASSSKKEQHAAA